ncbi:phage terminase small subunit [Pasteurella multocida]|nr:terminase [Pasteurella multocida]HDR1874075.1 terminase [Pasteurella multocida]HDR1894435.1 terminase [Pasteurella multocida]HED4406668.1 terminase [Pasteurella multocida]
MGLREQQAQMRELAKLQQAQVNIQANAQAQMPSITQSAVAIALEQDVEKIRSFSAFADRNSYKRNHFLPSWLPFVEQHFKDGRTDQNDVIGYCLVYLLDLGDFDQAFNLAQKAIENGQKLPERFGSSIPTFVAKHMLDWTIHTTAMGNFVEPYFSQTLENVATAWQLNEVLTALWFKQAAVQLLKNATGKAHAASVFDPERLTLAIKLLRKAFYLNHKSGVTNLINRCFMRLNALLDSLEKAGIDTTHFMNPAQEAALAENNPEIDIKQVVVLLNRPPLSLDDVIKEIQVQQSKGVDYVQRT